MSDPQGGDGRSRLRLAIADPPYLGRARRWYGDGRGPGRGRTQTGRNGRQPDQHPDAQRWDRVQTHHQLIEQLTRDYDGWALACAPDSLSALLPAAPADATVGIWLRPNAMPGGGRILRSWEPVIFYVSKQRRGRDRGMATRDALTAPVRQQGFLGSKPPEWTRWVLAMLGYDPGLDDLDDLFAGSGAVAAAAEGMLALPMREPICSAEQRTDNVIPLRRQVTRTTRGANR